MFININWFFVICHITIETIALGSNNKLILLIICQLVVVKDSFNIHAIIIVSERNYSICSEKDQFVIVVLVESKLGRGLHAIRIVMIRISKRLTLHIFRKILRVCKCPIHQLLKLKLALSWFLSIVFVNSYLSDTKLISYIRLA